MSLFILPTNTCFGIATPINNIEGYKSIYKIKARDLNKPLAILVDDFIWLKENTDLTNEQIDFLENYRNPFTILLDIKKVFNNDLLKNISKLDNYEIYKKIAFRISHNFMHKKLIRLNGPLFLTSANKSGEPELINTKSVKKSFKDEIKKYDIKVFAHNNYCINNKQKSSDIFEFIGESIEIKFLRN